jgi:glycine betaine/proline transport system permease protein
MTMERAAQRQATPSFRVPAVVKVAAILVAVAGVSLVVRELAPWATDYPVALVLPLSDWITAFFEWLPYVDLGLFTVRDVTKSFVWLLNQPLLLTEGLLFRGFPEFGLPPLPWVVIVVLAGVIGFNAGGPRLALLAVLGTGYLALFGLWALSMETFSLVIVTVPIVALVGLALGILAIRRPRFEAALQVLFDVLQCTPHLAYLVPVVVLFGLGQVPAIIATGIFAMPPMARCVILGIRSVPREVIEAGVMAGATRHQLLWRVQFPAARPIVMVGLNQVIMQTLAMVVIASLIGAKGLGHDVLVKLDMLWLGRALEAGVGIVVLAVLLDRISQAYATRRRIHRKTEETSRRRLHLAVGASLLGVAILLGALDHRFRVPTPEWTVSTAAFWDGLVDYVSEHWYGPLMAFRNAALVYVLIPVKDVLSWLPWTVVVAGVGANCRSCIKMGCSCVIWANWKNSSRPSAKKSGMPSS